MAGVDKVIGKLITIAVFPSNFVKSRRVDIWLPRTFKRNRKYWVVYMQDSQNLFIPALSYTKIDWGMDEIMTELMESGEIPPAIVVGIGNTEYRTQEMMPQRAFTRGGERKPLIGLAPLKKRVPLLSDNYLQFIVKEVKPIIDSHYPVYPTAEQTITMGSSMGGLISLYALCEYPHIFAKAGCISSHWPIGGGCSVQYMQNALPKPGHHRIYFDYGDQGIDKKFEPFQRRVDRIMQAAGYQKGVDWVTKFFPGDAHHESTWRKRVVHPLKFLIA